MKKLALFSLIAIISCHQVQQKEATTDTTIHPIQINIPADSEKTAGDFDGDGQKEFAFAVKVKEGHGNPVEDGVPDEYAINFSNTNIPSMNIGCCEVRLINEGDLNGDGANDLTVFQAPMNGNGYSLSTYSFKNKAGWKVIIEPLLIPTAGEPVTDEDLQRRIFLEKDTIYCLDVDVNDENFQLNKKSVTLK